MRYLYLSSVNSHYFSTFDPNKNAVPSTHLQYSLSHSISSHCNTIILLTVFTLITEVPLTHLQYSLSLPQYFHPFTIFSLKNAAPIVTYNNHSAYCSSFSTFTVVCIITAVHLDHVPFSHLLLQYLFCPFTVFPVISEVPFVHAYYSLSLLQYV